jgi:hypothetical protein
MSRLSDFRAMHLTVINNSLLADSGAATSQRSASAAAENDRSLNA